MVASEHPEVIEGRRRLISTDVLEYEEAADDGSIDNDGAAFDEEYDSGSGVTGVRTCVTKSETEEWEEMQRVMKYSYLSSYMFEPPYLLTQVFNKNNKAQGKIFKHM